MSSILKALKKLEEEKAVRKGDSVKVGRGILLNDPPGKRERPVIILLSMVVVAIVAVVVTLAAMGGFGGRKETKATGVSEPSRALFPTPAAPLPAPATVALPPPAMPVAAPDRQALSSVGKRNVPLPSPVPPVATIPAIKDEGATNPLVEHLPPEMTLPYVPKAPPVTAAVPSHPGSFSLSGIAWQKDSAGRIAMINGQAVGKGGMIAGAVVEEILPDRVRLGLEGKSFDIVLGEGSGAR